MVTLVIAISVAVLALLAAGDGHLCGCG